MILPQLEPLAACKHRHIGLDEVLQSDGFQKFQYLEYFSGTFQIVVIVAKSVVMKITVERKRAEQVEADALIVPVFQGRRDARFGAADLFDSGEVAGKPLELTLLHHPPGVRATRVLLAGAGKPEKFDAAEMRAVERGGAALSEGQIDQERWPLPWMPEFAGDDFASAAVEGAILGDFEPDRYKKGDDKKSVEMLYGGRRYAGSGRGGRARQDPGRSAEFHARDWSTSRPTC